MKQIIPIFLVLFFAVFRINAQKENNIWYFGVNAGVDFNSVVPVALTNGQLNSGEGCASICDKNGNILFYTDGTNVFDRTHSQMPNGTGLAGHRSATQSGVIVPKPGSNTRYYIFTVGSHDQFPGNLQAIPFAYSEVDMTLNGGLGDVIVATKNTILFTASTEKVTAIRHANGLYIWVIGEEMSGKYRSYLVDCNGLNIHPIISSVGHAALNSGLGYLKGAPDGQKLVNAMWVAGTYLLDFNKVTGSISNPLLLNTPSASSFNYGASFSPNGNLLYSLNINNTSGIITQWNLLAGSSLAIVASATTVGTALGGGAYYGGAIQIGPDGKLYIPQYNQMYLSVINAPNTIGIGCNFQTNAINLQGRNPLLGLPNSLQIYSDTITHLKHCFKDQTSFSLGGTANYADSALWDFGDPLSGSHDTSTDKSPTHEFTAPGTYKVRAITYLPCSSDTNYTTVVIDSMPIVNLGADINICADSVILQSSHGHSSAIYNWSNGATTPTVVVSQSGTYILQVTQGTCTRTDTIKVDIASKLNVNLGPDTIICDNSSLTLTSPQPAGTQYVWSNGLNASKITVTQAGKYWLYISRNGCYSSDTINVSIVNVPSIYIGSDSIICETTPLKIGAFIPDATYKWNNDSTTAFINVSKTGNYILTVTLGPCTTKDTVAIIAMPKPSVDLGVDTNICPKQIIVLNAGNDSKAYLWDNGSTNATDTVKNIGKYWVEVTSQYKCIGSDTIYFKAIPLPSVILGNDTTVCEETPFTLKPIYSINEDEIRWSTGSTERQIPITQGGVYYLQAFNKCGSVSDTINIQQIFCDILIPNAFTPNGDGINDILKVLGSIERVQNFQLSLYNRWGEQVFITTDKYAGWDGKYKDSDCATDIFVYILQYSIDGQPILQKGNVTLIR